MRQPLSLRGGYLTAAVVTTGPAHVMPGHRGTTLGTGNPTFRLQAIVGPLHTGARMRLTLFGYSHTDSPGSSTFDVLVKLNVAQSVQRRLKLRHTGAF